MPGRIEPAVEMAFSDADRPTARLRQGREPESVKRSLMTGCVFGRDETEVNKLIEETYKGQRTLDDLQERGIAVGTASQIVDHLGELSEAGVQRVMLQWLDLDDIDRLEAMANGILPQLQ